MINFKTFMKIGKKMCIIKELSGDLFAAPKNYSLAHCVASDLRMGKGIAVKFRDTFGQIGELKRQSAQAGGLAVIKDRDRYIYYLVTKQLTYQKPTYNTMYSSLMAMKEHMIKSGVNKLAIPRIGCGLDGLVWNKVKDQLQDIFNDIDVEIIVYNYSPNK